MKRSSLTLSFLLLTTSLVHAESNAEKALQAIIDDVNGTGIFTMKVGSVHYASDTDTLTAQNVVYGVDWSLPDMKTTLVKDGDAEKKDFDIEMTFTIPTFTAKGLELSGDGYKYDSITYEGSSFDMNMEDNHQDLVIAGKANGKDILSDGFQPFMGKFEIDPDHPITSVMDFMRPLIMKPSIGSVTSEGYTVTQKVADGEVFQTTDLGPLSMTDFSDGKLGAYEVAYQRTKITPEKMGTADAVKEAAEKPDFKHPPLPQNVTYNIGKTRYEGYDFAAFWSALDPKAPALEGKTVILDNVTMEGAEVDVEGVFSLTSGPSIQKGFALSTSAPDLLPLIDKMIANKQEPDDLAKEEQEKLIQSAMTLVRGASMELAEAKDIEVTITLPAGIYKGHTAKGGFGSMRMSDLSSNGIKEISASQISYAGPPSVDFALDRVALENLEFPDYMQIEKAVRAGIAGQKPSKGDMAKLAPNALDIVISGLSYSDEMENSVTATSINAGFERQGLAIPALVKTKIDDLVVSRSMLQHPFAQILLSQLGMDKLTVNEEITLSFNEADETLKLDPISLDLPGIAQLSGTIGLGGIKKSHLEDPDNMQSAMLTASVLPSNLSLLDQGGVNDLINIAGTMSGLGPDQMRSMIEGQVNGILSSFTQADFANQVTEQVKLFLSDPKNLRIMVSPASPVPLAQVMMAVAADPKAIPDLLNIGVTANQ